MYHRRKVLVDFNLLFLRLIAYRRDAQRIFTGRQVLELKLAFFVGYRSLSATHNQNGGIRYVLFRTFHKDMAGNHIAFPYRVCGNSRTDTHHGKHQRQYIMFHLNNRFYFCYRFSSYGLTFNIYSLKNQLFNGTIPVSTVGTADTRRWYGEYQALVRQIPNVGTTNTKRWYGKYRTLVQTISKGNGIRGSAERNHPIRFSLDDGRIGFVFHHPQQRTHRVLYFAAIRFVRTEVRQQTDSDQRSSGV